MLQATTSATSSRLIAAVEDRVAAACQISLFVDFDGTLVPIVDDPSAAQLAPDVARTLTSLVTKRRIHTTVISGRALEDLYSRVRIDGLTYAGNHGLEISGQNLRFTEPDAAARREELEQLSLEVRSAIASLPGAFVEFKGLTASVHYRQSPAAVWPLIEHAVFAAVAPHGAAFRVNPGRKVFELVPRTNWHKGTAVHWINERFAPGRVLSIYLGDDSTDEDAFSVMTEAITIKVGSAPATCARYRLAGPAAVHEFLEWLALAPVECKGGNLDG